MANTEPQPTNPDLLLRVSLRIKAARFLAGRRDPEKGTRAIAMTVEELAEHPLIVENGISKNRLQDYEGMAVTQPRPMELRVIAEALEVPQNFLLAPLTQGDEQSVEAMLEDLQSTLNFLKDRLPQLGRDIGRRGPRSQGATGRPPRDSPAAA